MKKYCPIIILFLRKKQNIAIFLFCISLISIFPNSALSDNITENDYKIILENMNSIHYELRRKYGELIKLNEEVIKQNKELKDKIKALAEPLNKNEQSDIMIECFKDMICRMQAVSLPLGEDVALEIVYVEDGTFKMGTEESEIEGLLYESENEEVKKELPAHEVASLEFYIGKYEVTNKQYELFLKERGQNKRKRESIAINWDSLPVNNVSLDEAVKFTKWLKDKLQLEVRLPTEEEWEWAARGAKNLKYPWGNDNPAQNGEYGHWGDKLGRPVKVGSCGKGKSWCGAFDMSGNVSEWMGNSYYSYSGDSSVQSEKEYVTRGGSYASDIIDVRTASRYVISNDTGKPVVGFRVLVQLR